MSVGNCPITLVVIVDGRSIWHCSLLKEPQGALEEPYISLELLLRKPAVNKSVTRLAMQCAIGMQTTRMGKQASMESISAVMHIESQCNYCWTSQTGSCVWSRHHLAQHTLNEKWKGSVRMLAARWWLHPTRCSHCLCIQTAASAGTVWMHQPPPFTLFIMDGGIKRFLLFSPWDWTRESQACMASLIPNMM